MTSFRQYSSLQWLVFDLADVVDAISPQELTGGRIAMAGGSFFEGVPSGAFARRTRGLADRHAMAMFGDARAGSAAAFHALLADSGFVLPRVMAAASSLSLVEAAPA